MQKTLQKGLLVLLILFVMFSSIPMNGLAKTMKENLKETETKQENSNTKPALEDPENGEVVSERTENTRLFYDGNGEYTKQIYFDPIYKKDKAEGEWEELSSDISEVSSTELQTENANLTSTFPKKTSNGQYASFQYNEHAIEYSLLEASGKEQEPVQPSEVSADYKNNSNTITYSNILPDIDLRNISFNQNTKEDLILNQYNGFNIFKFKLKTNLQADIQDDGSIQFIDQNQKQVFQLPKPYMIDSNFDEHSGESARSEDVTYKLDKTEDGYILTVQADSEWLKDANRKYPVYIDPTTSINTTSDAFAASAYPTTNYSSASSKWDEGLKKYILKVGYYDNTTGTNFAYLKQSLSSISNMEITNATFNVYVAHAYYVNTANGLWINANTQDWSANTVNWNNKPTSLAIGKVDVARNQWAKFDVTSTVQKWIDGSLKNYGFKLHTDGNGQGFWKKVVSSTNTDDKPYLSVTYTIPAPTGPAGQAYSNGNGTGYVDLNWKAVPGAIGYKIWVYNGAQYESINVGNVTSWSSKGQKIWPTEAEIKSGKFNLHTDTDINKRTGTELAIDPSTVYKNSGGNYSTNTNYWFRISAVYSQGESSYSTSYYRPTLPNLNLPQAPEGMSYSNGNGTGYLDFNWKPVKDAKGYKIWLYNGKEYESKDVGNVTSWSTKDQKYWPTTAEVKAGKYKLHLNDNSGVELPVDPSPVYHNSGGNYGTATNYWVRISAYNDQGETVFSSYYRPNIPDLSVPTNINAFPYTNMVSSNSGYVQLNWDPVDEATGYKVWLYNGINYESFDVGDKDSWTTQNQGIWPTDDEIAKGRFELHHDKSGTELSTDPSPVYRNSKGHYTTNTNYWFKVSAYNNDGETIVSKYIRPTIGAPTELLGTEDYWSIIDVTNGSVNAATGNLIISETDFSIDGRGPTLGLNRTYNSLSPSIGLFGAGWHSDAEMKMEAMGNEVIFTDEDGTVHHFLKESDGSYKPPTGVYLELKDTTNEYILTSKDQSEMYFNKKDGHLIKIVDGHNNVLSYTFTDNQLQSIKDASGRTLLFEYNKDGFVSKITDPKSKDTTFDYVDNQLVSVINANSEKTIYEYDEDGRLIKYYSPTHIPEKPVATQFGYDKTTNRMMEVTNPEGKKTTFDYNTPKRELTVTMPNGKKMFYVYNAAGNPTEVTVDPDGLKLTTTYNYEGNNLKESRDPNDQSSIKPTESYQYDSNGNVTTAEDSYGKETYQYNKNNDVTSYVDTEGDETTVAYDGLNAVSETDQSGKTSSISKYDKYGNEIESSGDLAPSNNQLLNNNFEDGTTSWNVVNVKDDGKMVIDPEQASSGMGGKQSIKLSSQTASADSEHGYIAATQVLSVLPNVTYTLSGQIKTSNLKNAQAFFNISFIDGTGKHISWADNRYSQLTGTKKWTKRQLTFKTPENAAKIKIFLEVDHTSTDASGEAWFDALQLEQGEVSSKYNPVINSSFEQSLGNWSGSGGSVDKTGFEGDKSLKINRTSSTQTNSRYKQTVSIGQKPEDKPLVLTLTGLSKSENVKNGSSSDPNADYALLAKVYLTDGTSKSYEAKFPLGTQDWNRSAVKIDPNTPIDKIELTAVFQNGNTGTVWFDGIRLLEGNVITKQTFDNNGNYATRIEDELGHATLNEYDEIGNLLTETDPKGHKKSYVYDAMDRLKELTLLNSTKVTYEFDKNGNNTNKSIISSDGKTQTFHYEYDRNDQLKQVTDPLGGLAIYQYDDNGNQIKTTFPNGKTQEWKYDGADRQIETLFDGKKMFTFGYDKNGNERSVTDVASGTSKEKTYDSSNRLRTLIERGGKIEWTYPTTSDKMNQLLFSHGTTSLKTTFEYNTLDQNTVVKDGIYSYQFDYDEQGNVGTYTAGNGSGSTFVYDDAGKINSLAVGTKKGDILLEEHYRYDENGNRTKIEYPDGSDISYEFDSSDQLTKESLKNGTEKSYKYDGFGNRTNVNVTSKEGEISTDAEYNSANQLTKFGNEKITYDQNGNRLSDGKYIYGWNAADQLISITKKEETAPFAKYVYDEDGRRIQKIVDGKVTNYYYDGESLNVLYETDEQDKVVRSYVYSQDGQLLALRKGSDTYFYHYNAHGDVIALTDKENNIVADYQYDAWGNVLQSDEQDSVKDNPYRYAGYQFDKETGLYYLMARYYNPNHGVFLSMDPDPGDDDDILTQNGYTYGNNNPVMLVDPDGHWVWLVINAGFAIYDGYKAYKAGKSKKRIAWAAASSFVGIGKINKVSRAAKYAGRVGKQTKLKSLLNHKHTPRHVKGHIKNELRHIKSKKRKTIRVPQGYNLAHKRGYEARKGYGYAHTVLQNIKNHKTQHKYDGNGRRR
ncbi:DNRLRE domain-containing protein [Heyndrickxia vini]|uniref:DNRLRE domain-containing protein n=1 Tax=Heyndrickxia vini TaxID=1476025 RepID=UPI001FE4ED80|nr:DNRLRE domain-containing protein [Heyndrickxia vini]